MADTIGHAHTLAEVLKRDNRTFFENYFDVTSYEDTDLSVYRHHEIVFTAK